MWTRFPFIRGNQISLSWVILSKSILPINDIAITFQGAYFYFDKIVSMSYVCVFPVPISPTFFKKVIFTSLQSSSISLILYILKENQKWHLNLLARYFKYYFKLFLMQLVLKRDRISDLNWKSLQNFMSEDTSVE